MICNKCNREIAEGVKFCTYCGAIQEIKEEKAPTVINVVPTVKEKVIQSNENAENATLPPINEVEIIEPIAEKENKKQSKKAEKASKKAKIEEETAVDTEKVEKKREKKKSKQDDEYAELDERITESENSPKSKDKVNFFLLLLTLLCPPYFGVLITICNSAKAPKATQVYGIFTILSFIFSKIKNYILTVIATFSIIMAVLAALVSGAYHVMTELGYDITFITDFVSSYLNF
ncbi:MAG: zinc-ribbon domain-containing protein [Clostridia bacterium]|nr:zinc-ribbon domain-containing protein [Clostridia bacterium]